MSAETLFPPMCLGGSAEVSSNKLCRYLLTRRWGQGALLNCPIPKLLDGAE